MRINNIIIQWEGRQRLCRFFSADKGNFEAYD